jgi:aminopeptidase N
MLALETNEDATLPRLADSAEAIAPLLEHWFGAPLLSALTVLDHAGQPFEDGPFLVAPIATLAGSDASSALAHSLTHAWVQTGQPWMDEGLAQFAALLWVEQSQGRERAVAELNDLLQPLILAEPLLPQLTAQPATTPLPAPAGEPLITATDELYTHRKAVAVWFMLRGIVGEDALRETLAAWRMQPPSNVSAREQALALEKLLEKTSGKELAWFFHDWVLNDQGLPDLSIAGVTTRDLSGDQIHKTGWLVSVTVRNDGGAGAEVPVIVRSGTFSTTKRLLIPAYGQVSDRVLVEAAPTQVLVNDGTTPEVRASQHQRDLVPQPQH